MPSGAPPSSRAATFQSLRQSVRCDAEPSPTRSYPVSGFATAILLRSSRARRQGRAPGSMQFDGRKAAWARRQQVPTRNVIECCFATLKQLSDFATRATRVAETAPHTPSAAPSIRATGSHHARRRAYDTRAPQRTWDVRGIAVRVPNCGRPVTRRPSRDHTLAHRTRRGSTAVELSRQSAFCLRDAHEETRSRLDLVLTHRCPQRRYGPRFWAPAHLVTGSGMTHPGPRASSRQGALPWPHQRYSVGRVPSQWAWGFDRSMMTGGQR